MNDDQLINKKFHILQRNKILNDKDKFIYKEVAKRINNSLEGINLSLENILEIGYSSEKTTNYLNSRFDKINLYAMDISDKILKNLSINSQHLCIDHDKWTPNIDKFELIISNFYLHLTNNFDNLLKKINLSLKKNGFFMATLPGLNCFHELKDIMIKADIEFYGGAYRRFNDSFSIQYISDSLKKNNFKIPVIEIDNIQLRYKNFKNLLDDIRNLGNSNLYYDRKKKFEKKKYFNKLEELYWNNYSNNNELILQLELIFISGWKEDLSQQKPLKPGEAKNSLTMALK